MKKYALNYDKVNTDIRKRILTVNGRIIRFSDIKSFTVEEGEQPDPAEKYLTKSGYYCYMTFLILNLKDGSRVKCRFNYKGSIYKVIKTLSPYVKADVDAEIYNPYSFGSVITGIILIACSAIAFGTLLFKS